MALDAGIWFPMDLASSVASSSSSYPLEPWLTSSQDRDALQYSSKSPFVHRRQRRQFRAVQLPLSPVVAALPFPSEPCIQAISFDLYPPAPIPLAPSLAVPLAAKVLASGWWGSIDSIAAFEGRRCS